MPYTIVPKKELCHTYGTTLDSMLRTAEKLWMMEWPFVADVAVMFVQVVEILQICFATTLSTTGCTGTTITAKENKKPLNTSSSSATNLDLANLFSHRLNLCSY